MKKFTIQRFLPQKASSWLMFKLTRIKLPWFKNFFITYFAKIFNVNWEESKIQDVNEFKTFNEFFTRELKKNARTIAETPFVMPADGVIACFGQLDKTQFIKAKGHDFSLASLLADPNLANEFTNGSYATIYLSPRDYHRIHMPANGILRKMIHIPGKLYSVSLKTAVAIPNLFAQNERVVCIFDSNIGKFALILVGAINVSSIETIWSGTITPPYGEIIRYQTFPDNPEYHINKGAEMGRFNMGSTVIVIAQNPQEEYLTFVSTISEDKFVQMGTPLMHFTK